MLKINLFQLSFLLFLSSCIKSLDTEFPQSDNRLLVIEGGISTRLGPHSVQLSRTARFGSIFEGVIEPETGAVVSVRDNDGRISFLEEGDNGSYFTSSDFRAEVGKSYSLQIITRTGEEYNSIPELVRPVAEINQVSTRFVERESNDPLIPITGVELIVEFTDPPGNQNFYRWNYFGTYVIKARPDLHLDGYGNPDPLDCCTTCYTTESNNFPNVLSDNAFDGRTNQVPVAFIFDDGIRFGDRYHIVIQQQSLSPEAYNFFELVNEQLSIDGDIFDPPPATVRGNFINLENTNQNVIGYFTATDVRLDSMYIFPSALDFVNQSVIRGDCREQKGNATIVAPDFWE